jgi:hypothetical protein
MGSGLVLRMDSAMISPFESRTTATMVASWTSKATYLSAVIRVLLS